MTEAHPWPDRAKLDFSGVKAACEAYGRRYALYGSPWSPLFQEVGWLVGQSDYYTWMTIRCSDRAAQSGRLYSDEPFSSNDAVEADRPAQKCFRKCRARRKALAVLYEEHSYTDVVGESQEICELLLKGVLRIVGIDPPKFHDVGRILKENREMLPESMRGAVDAVARYSFELGRDRELSFYRAVDVDPWEDYTVEDADCADRTGDQIRCEYLTTTSDLARRSTNSFQSCANTAFGCTAIRSAPCLSLAPTPPADKDRRAI